MTPNGSSTPDPDEMWEEFKKLICKLYELYGGDCADLDWGDEGEDGVRVVQTEFDNNGLPNFTSPGQEQQFRSDLDQLELVSNSNAVPPSAAAKADALSMIAAMRAALNGPA